MIGSTVVRGASNALVSIASTSACIVLMEAAVRIYFGVGVLELRDFRASRVVNSTLGQAAEYDPRLGWVVRDHFASEQMNTTTYGIRNNHESDGELKIGGILAVGDSFTAGSEVRDFESWPAQLEELLGEPVTNAGVGGYGTDQILMRADQLIPVLQPRLVIVGFLADDILRSGYSSYGRPKPFFELRNDELVLKNVPVPSGGIDQGSKPNKRPSLIRRAVGYSLIADHILAGFYPSFWFSREKQSYARNGSDEVEVTCLLLQRFKRRVDADGISAILLMQHGGQWISDRNEPSGHAQLVSQCAREAGLPVVDEFDSLRAVYSAHHDELRRYYVMHPGDTFGHMSAHGNSHVAQLLAEAVRTPKVSVATEHYRSARDEMFDGKNLLSRSESFGLVFEHSPTVELLQIQDGPTNPRQLLIQAAGGQSEHYAQARVEAPPGTYIFSLEATPETSRQLRVQLLDEGSSGVIGTFDLSEYEAVADRLGLVRSPAARIERTGSDWARLWIRARLPEKNPRILVQLLDRTGQHHFPGGGESLRIRRLQIEQGVAPTPYKPTSGPARAGFVAGNGIDLLSSVRAFESQIGRPGITAVSHAELPEAHLPSYKIQASGGVSEHYLGLQSPPLGAGPYTFSFLTGPRIAEASASVVRVQLLSGTGDGVMVDFDLEERQLSLFELGSATATDAGIHPDPSGLDRFWLSGEYPEGYLQVLIQLRSQSGEWTFAPSGESVILLSPILEHGHAPGHEPLPISSRSDS